MIQARTRLGGFAIVIALALLAAGCSTHKCHLCDVAPKPSKPWTPPPEPAYFCGDDLSEEFGDDLEVLTAASARSDGFDLLLLSGGGSRGSFGAGLLYGWKDSPEFDMVTGISTGAIMASWAYLGPDYKIPPPWWNPNQKELEPYTIMKDSYGGDLGNAEIRKRRWLFPFVDSLYSLEPLRETMLKVLPTEMLVEVGRVSKATKRQLWIGSTNVETGQFCHWNLGARAEKILAAYEAKDQARADALAADYHNLILASSANPTVFKAIKVGLDGDIPAKDEPYFYHVDGGVSDTVYVERLGKIASEVRSAREMNPDLPLTVHAVINGRLVSSQQCLESGAAPIAIRSINLLSKSSLRGNLNTISVTVDEGLGVSRADGGWTLKVARIDYRLSLTPADAFVRNGKDENQLGMEGLFKEGESWAAANDQSGRWCEGIPAIGNTDSYCELPVAGRIKASCSD